VAGFARAASELLAAQFASARSKAL
jgi:hypothetical protein